MFQLLLSIIIFITGLAVGSFINCVVWRMENKESFLRGRSYCPNCRHQLSWRDLIPLFSFIFLKGRCRYCQKKISIQYPLVEIITGVLFLLIYNFPACQSLSLQALAGKQFSCLPSLCSGCGGQAIFNFINFLFLLVISCFLIIIFIYDLKYFIIPDKIIFPAIGIALIFNFQFSIFNQFSITQFSIFSAFGAAVFFLAIFLISRGKWLGFGDVKLAFLIGLFLGFPNIIPALFFSFLLGAIIGIGLIALKKKNLKSEVPFGPFLVTGTFIALFWGERIVEWYLSLFL